MTVFWLSAVAMTLFAIGLLLAPIWRRRSEGMARRWSVIVPVLAIVPVAFGLYLSVTTYQSLDAASWQHLGDQHRAQGNYGRARMAYEEAWKLTPNPDDNLKLGYAEMMIYTDPESAQGLAGDLVEGVLASRPDDPAALWLGGIVAVERDQRSLATQRLTALLATNPPDDIADIIRQQLMVLAGNSAGPSAAGAASAATSPADASAASARPAGAGASTTAAEGPVINFDLSVGEGISLDRFGPNARLYLLARAPGMRQPIAVVQRLVSELPGRFSLSDANAMLGGSLAQYDSVDVVARISASGTAIEQPGDVYAEASVSPTSDEVVKLVLDQVVPGA
jgi:cytochrome c-type biogenesis protein CcmH